MYQTSSNAAVCEILVMKNNGKKYWFLPCLNKVWIKGKLSKMLEWPMSIQVVLGFKNFIKKVWNKVICAG